ncbi:MAG: hypothetical protein ACKVVT_10330 [Dehalococcoidia bacterium]
MNRWTTPLAGLGLVLVAFFFGASLASPEPAQAAQVIGAGSCTPAGACDNLPANVTIGTNSCTGDNACDDLVNNTVIGDNSCNADAACLSMGSFGGSATVGDNSCNGTGMESLICHLAGGSNGSVTIGDNACLGAFACLFAGSTGVATIADGACVQSGSCASAGRDGGHAFIGSNSCIGPSACDGAGKSGNASTATIGNGSCIGEEACAAAGSFGGSFSAGDDSCQDDSACSIAGADPASSASVGNGSCNGERACDQLGYDGGAAGLVGNHSCNRDPLSTCPGVGQGLDVTIGDCELNEVFVPACSSDTTAPETLIGLAPAAVTNDNTPTLTYYATDPAPSDGLGSFTCSLTPGPAVACPGSENGALLAGPLPDGLYTFSVFATDFAGNADATPATVTFRVDATKPTVTATLIDASTGQPYVPGTPTRGPVRVAFTCTDESGGSGIPQGSPHNDTGPSGKGNTFPASADVQRTSTFALDPGWRCVDAAGNQSDSPAGFPFSVVIDRRAPTCSIALSRTSVPRNGTPTSVTVTVSGTDDLPGLVTRRIIAISPAPTAGPAVPDTSPGTWTLTGAFGKAFTFTAEVKDAAGNTRTCSKKVSSR